MSQTASSQLIGPEKNWVLSRSLASLAESGTERRFKTGTILINQGDSGGNLFIVLNGSVRAYTEGPNGRVLTLGTYHRGEYVGEMALDGGPRSASVITVGPTECAVVSGDVLRSHIHKDPDFAIDLIMRLIQRTRIATESARGLALLDVYGRVRQLLEEQAVTQSDGSRVLEQKLTHQDIADQVGASREMISKILKELAMGGYIEIHKKKIHILRLLPAGW